MSAITELYWGRVPHQRDGAGDAGGEDEPAVATARAVAHQLLRRAPTRHVPAHAAQGMPCHIPLPLLTFTTWGVYDDLLTHAGLARIGL
jgi:hypothetical protein